MVTPPRREAQAAPPLTRFRLLAESNALASQIVKDFNLSDPRFGLSAQRFRERSLAVDEVRGTNLLRIRVRLGDPAVATSVCNSLATKLIDLQQQLDLGSAAIMADSLKDQLTQAEHKLRTAEDRFEGYNAKAQVELTQEDANARLTQRGALVALLVDIEADKARLRAAEAEIKNYEPILAAPRLVGAEQALGHQRANAEADSTRRELDASAERADAWTKAGWQRVLTTVRKRRRVCVVPIRRPRIRMTGMRARGATRRSPLPRTSPGWWIRRTPSSIPFTRPCSTRLRPPAPSSQDSSVAGGNSSMC